VPLSAAASERLRAVSATNSDAAFRPEVAQLFKQLALISPAVT